MRLLVVDSYDSFTYNLVQQAGVLGAGPEVMKSDAPREGILGGSWDRIVLSPGPGRPEESPIYREVLAGPSRTVPTLGVCLGHQAIGCAFGATLVRAERVMHGRVSEVHHDGRGVFAGLDDPFPAGRYHSLLLAPESIPETLEVTAWSDDGCVMGVRHRRYPITGIQFHPESILTPDGDRIMANFLARAGADP